MNLQSFKTHWKTSLQPILSVLLVAAPMATVDGSPIHNKTVLWAIAVITAIAKVGIGFVQEDAGTVTAITPSGVVTSVASHEVPDDPKVTVIK